MDVVEEEPGARSPAPGALRVVQLLVNTNDREGPRDLFDTPDGVTTWLRSCGWRDHTASESDRMRLVAVREALRAYLLSNNGEPPDVDAAAALDRELEASRTTLALETTGPTLRTDATGIDAVIGTILSIVFDAMLDGTWVRLKACRRHACQWAFYDRSRNRSGAWCTMSICGNRTKTSAYWRRSRHGDA